MVSALVLSETSYATKPRRLLSAAASLVRARELAGVVVPPKPVHFCFVRFELFCGCKRWGVATFDATGAICRVLVLLASALCQPAIATIKGVGSPDLVGILAGTSSLHCTSPNIADFISVNVIAAGFFQQVPIAGIVRDVSQAC